MKEEKSGYDEDKCYLLQQKAIERILSWSLRNAEKNGTLDKACRQFDEACSRMNRFGTKAPQPGQAYCTNRMRMDRFMRVPVMSLFDSSSDPMRARYREHVEMLGRLRDNYCQRSDYYGVTFVPGGSATYTGPGE